jgi:hypothetical protein
MRHARVCQLTSLTCACVACIIMIISLLQFLTVSDSVLQTVVSMGTCYRQCADIVDSYSPHKQDLLKRQVTAVTIAICIRSTLAACTCSLMSLLCLLLNIYN